MLAQADPAAFWASVSHSADASSLSFAQQLHDAAAASAALSLASPPPDALRSAAAALHPPPAALNVTWLAHLAGPAVPHDAPGTSAAERQELLRALAAALPELALYIEPLIAARGVPGEAFVGAQSTNANGGGMRFSLGR